MEHFWHLQREHAARRVLVMPDVPDFELTDRVGGDHFRLLHEHGGIDRAAVSLI